MKTDGSKAEVSLRLAQAWSHAEAGDATSAINLTRSLLVDGAVSPDEHQQGEALLCQASCELRLLGRFGRALELAQLAGLRFRQVDDSRGECKALATQAIAATRLGLHEVAVDSALLAVRLAHSLEPCRERVMAHEALGVAMFSGACYVESSNAFQQAVDLARACNPPLDALELHVDLASAEAHRHLFERVTGGRRLSLTALGYHLERCDALLAAAAAKTEASDSHPIGLASTINNSLILAMTRVQFLTWEGRLDEAAQALSTLKTMQASQARPWTAAAVCWARAELELAEFRNDDAAESALEME